MANTCATCAGTGVRLWCADACTWEFCGQTGEGEDCAGTPGPCHCAPATPDVVAFREEQLRKGREVKHAK